MSTKNIPRRNMFFSSKIYPLLVASLGLASISLGQIGSADIRVWEILLATFIVSVIIKITLAKRLIIPNKLAPMILFPLVVSVLLSGFNANRVDMWAKQTLFFAMLLMLYIIVCQRWSRIQLIQNLRWIIYPGILIAGWGILEYALFPETLMSFYNNGIYTPRATSLFAEPNEFSQFLTLPFGFLVSVLIYYRSIPRWERVFYLLGLLVVIAAQILTLSRGGLVAFAAVLLTYAGLRVALRKKIRMSIGWTVFLIAFFAVVLSVITFTVPDTAAALALYWERFISLFVGGDITAMIRLNSINFAFQESIKSPIDILFGIGLGNLPNILGAGIATTTNIFVDVYAELGLLGLISFCGILAITLILPLKTIKFLIKTGDEKLLSVFIGAYISFIGLIVGGLTYSTYMLNIFWFLGGLLLSRGKIGFGRQPDKRGSSE